MNPENPRHWRIHDDMQWGGDDKRYELRDGRGVVKASAMRWRDACRVLRALRIAEPTI